jgi:homoprotocatechuate degradation regulator HpaR
MPVPIRHRNLPLLLLQAREAVISHFRPLLNHFGLTEQQWRVVRVLEEEGELEPWQISERCQILKPSLTGVLARMEEIGLVQRRKLDADQRRQLVSNTRKSSQLVGAMAPLVERQYRSLERALGKGLVDELYAMLDRLLAAGHERVAAVPLPAEPRRAKRARTGSRAPAVSQPG